MRLFDLHCDTVYECFTRQTDLLDPGLAVNTRAIHRAGFDRYTQVFALWIDDRVKAPWALFWELLATAQRLLPQAGFGTRTQKAVLAVEGGALLEDRPERIEALAARGVKILSLTWNYENRLAGGALCDAALSKLGGQAIKYMNKVGMACDVSHLNQKSFYGAVEQAQRVLATHSNAAKVCPHPRNLTDHQLKLLAQKGAVVGLCPYPAFLGGPVYEQLYANICHMTELGVQVAIGSDFDGADMDSTLQTPADFKELRAYLGKKGLKTEFLDRIFYQNAETFFNTFTKNKI